jgi:hypothetical protein
MSQHRLLLLLCIALLAAPSLVHAQIRSVTASTSAASATRVRRVFRALGLRGLLRRGALERPIGAAGRADMRAGATPGGPDHNARPAAGIPRAEDAANGAAPLPNADRERHLMATIRPRSAGHATRAEAVAGDAGHLRAEHSAHGGALPGHAGRERRLMATIRPRSPGQEPRSGAP